MNHMFSPTAGAIGIDVGEATVRAVQVRWRGGRAHLAAGLAWPLRTPGTFAQEDAGAFAEALHRSGFQGRDVIAFAPHRSLLTTTMELPPRTSAAPIRQLARVEMARIHRLEVNSFELGMWDTPTPDRRPGATHAIVTALPTQAGEAMASLFADAGLRLLCLDTQMCALARVCDRAVSAVPSLVGVVKVGWSGCRVMLMHVGGPDGVLPVYERVVEEVSLAALTKCVEEKLGLSREGVQLALCSSAEDVAADAPSRDLLRHARAFQGEFLDRLVTETQRSFSYAVQMYPTLPMTTVLVTGEGHRVRGLKERIANTLGLDARDLVPSDAAVAQEGSTLGADGSLVPALGLAMLPAAVAVPTARRAA
ncbi:MAG TPA: hypothetical protein VHN77_09870 [Phycisphaerales bacterium]|nr:hypothetical protein [Phycisphaerales bacterium]